MTRVQLEHLIRASGDIAGVQNITTVTFTPYQHFQSAVSEKRFDFQELQPYYAL